MNAAEVLAAVTRHHARCAVVPELTIRDHGWLDRTTEGYISTPTRRIDALMFSTLERTAIEIKVSKADFRRDTWQKRAAWAQVVHRFVYAVPAGLLDGEHGLLNCGVWEIHDDGTLTVARKAKINRCPEPLPQQVVQTLAYRASKQVTA